MSEIVILSSQISTFENIPAMQKHPLSAAVQVISAHMRLYTSSTGMIQCFDAHTSGNNGQRPPVTAQYWSVNGQK